MPTATCTRAALWIILSNLLLVGAAMGQSVNHWPMTVAATAPEHQVHHSTRPSLRDREFQTITDMATAVAPEFGADILIRLSESSNVTDRSTKIRLLKKAFYLAPAAEQPVKRTTNGFSPDTRSGYLALAFRLQNLDRLSLQSRVVSDMLRLDAGHARELLGEIQLPALTPLDCQEPLTYDVAAFYETVGLIARDGLTAKDKREGQKLVLLVPYVSLLQSHTQIRPATQLLLSAELSPTDLGQLTNMFAYALSQLHGDERSFAVTNKHTDEYSAPGAIASLIAALDARGIPSIALLRAFRGYLVSNFGEERCGETVSRSADKDSLPEAVRFFNQQLRSALQNAQITPISAEELKSARIGPKLADTNFWESPEAKQLSIAVKGLRFGYGETQLTAQKKATSAWSSQLTDFLTELGAWKSENEPAEVDFFCEKSALYSLLIEEIPNGWERSNAIADFVEFLEQNAVQPINRLEWILPAERLLSGAMAADDREEVIQAFLNSRDPALSLYARLERWEPRNTGPGSKPNAMAVKAK